MTAKTLAQLLFDTAAQNPQRVAVIDAEGASTYAQLASAVRVWAKALIQVGVQPGDRVALLLPKQRAQVVGIYACALVGAVFVPVNRQLQGGQMRYILDHAQAAFVLTQADVLRRARLEPGAEQVILVEDLPSLVETSAAETENITAAAVMDFASIAHADDLAVLLYTSGSTGKPKGVMLSHANCVAGARIVCGYLELTADDRLMAALPFSFDYGLNQLFCAVFSGASVRLLEFVFANQILECLQQDRCTVLAGVPTLWNLVATTTASFAEVLPQLRLLTNSGGALPVKTIDALRRAQPQADLILMYGLTEAFRSTYVPAAELTTHMQSIGWPIPESEVFLVDENDQLCPIGKRGMLVHAGPTVAMGYWNNAEASARVFRPDPRQPHPTDESASTSPNQVHSAGARRVVYSGDYAVQDADGSFRFLGRRDTLIKSSGYRVSPTEVEAALLRHPAVAQVAVIGIDDPMLGQRVHAICVAATTACGDVDPQDLFQLDREVIQTAALHLAAYQTPRQIEWVPALPLTVNGKVDYTSLVLERCHAD